MATALEIFHRLIDDPDYQATGDKSREEVVWDEAKQRERQSTNNNRALSLAWTDSPSLKSLITYLEKADDDGEGDSVLQPIKRTPSEGLKEASEGHYKSETPITKLLEALRLHKEADGLGITGRNPIGSLNILAGPHLNAIQWLAGEGSINPPKNEALISNRRELERKYTPEDEIDEDSLSSSYKHEILSRMTKEYAGIERDYRAITEMLRTGNVFSLEHSRYTSGEEAFKATTTYGRSNYLRQKSDELNAVRLPLLEDILAYIPTTTELGDTKYLTTLPEDILEAGMYGKQWVPSSPTGGGTRNLDNFPFGDADAVQKQVDNKLITQEEAEGLINLEAHNDIALAQHFNKFGPNMPINTRLDPQRGNLQIEQNNESLKQIEAFQSFDRLTKNHPNSSMGRRNLYKLLDKATQQPDADPLEQGFFRLPEDASGMLNRLSPDMRTRFLNMLVGPLDGESEFNMATMLNPDNANKSPIMSVLRDFLDVEEIERKENENGSRQKAFDRVKDRSDTTLTQDQWDVLKGDGGADTLARDLGRRINPSRLPPDPLATIDDAWWEKTYNGEHKTYPFSPLGQPVHGVDIVPDSAVPIEGKEPTPAQLLHILRKRVYGDAKSGDVGEKATLENGITEIREAEKELAEKTKKSTEDKFVEDWETYEANHRKFQGEVAEEIATLKADERQSIPNPELASAPDELSPAQTKLKAAAVTFLEEKGIDLTEENLIGLIENESFQRRENIFGGRLITELPERILEDQETFEARQLENQVRIKGLQRILDENYTDDASLTSEDGEGTPHTEDYTDALKTRNEKKADFNWIVYGEGVSPDEYILQKQLEQLMLETGEAETALSIDIFKKQRVNAAVDKKTKLPIGHFNAIIDHAKKNGVTLRSAADTLGHILTPLELEYLNSIDNEARLVHNISFGGDIANGLHNLEMSTDNPSLSIQTEGHNSDEEIREAIEGSAVYQALQNIGVRIEINPTMGTIPAPTLNKIDLYNPESAWRGINPYKSTQVAYPNIARILSPSIARLMGEGNIGRELSFSRMWANGFDKIPAVDKEYLYEIMGGVRPTYLETIDEGAGYHFRDVEHAQGLRVGDKVDKEHHGWVVERTDKRAARANKLDPTGKRRKVYPKEDLMEALQQKFDPDGGQDKGRFNPETLLATRDKDLDAIQIEAKNLIVEADVKHRPKTTPEGVLNIDKNGRLSREEDKEVTDVGVASAEMTQSQADERSKRITAVRKWAEELHEKHLSTVVNPLLGHFRPEYNSKGDIVPNTWGYDGGLSTGRRVGADGTVIDKGLTIHGLLSLIPQNDHPSIFSDLNVRDDETIIGQALEAIVVEEEDSEGQELKYFQKLRRNEETGEAVKGEFDKILSEVGQDIPEMYREQHDAPVRTIQNPEMYKGAWIGTDKSLEELFNDTYRNIEGYQRNRSSDVPRLVTRINEDGLIEQYIFEKDERKRRILDVKTAPTQTISKHGVGLEDVDEPKVGRLEKYYRNVMSGLKGSKANLDRDDLLRQKRLDVAYEEQTHIRRGKEASDYISLAPLSGLPLKYIDEFHKLMQKWAKIENAPRHKVPAALLEDIEKNLPEFSLEGTSGRHSFLEQFLTNVYRQFSQWEEDQRAVVLEEMGEEALSDMDDLIVNEVNRENKGSRDRKERLEARLAGVRGEEREKLQEELSRLKVYDNITTGHLNTEGSSYRNLDAGLRGILEKIRSAVETEAIEGVQEGTIQDTGKTELDRMFHPGDDEGEGGGKKVSVVFTKEDINIPKGGTHIPVDETGQIVTDQYGLAMVASLPFEVVFPPERFGTRSMVNVDVGKLQGEDKPSYWLEVPSTYWWLRDPNIGPVLTAVAGAQGITLEDLLSDVKASVFNAEELIEGGLVNKWLQEHGFYPGVTKEIAGRPRFKAIDEEGKEKASSLPASLIENPILNLDDPVQMEKIKNIRQILEARTKARGGGAVAEPTKDVPSGEPLVDHSVGHLSLNAVGRADQELQELLFNIFGGNREGLFDVGDSEDRLEQETFLEGMFRSLGLENDVFSPALTRDAETGEPGFDLGTRLNETGNPQIVDIHKRLNDFLQFFEVASLPESTVYRGPRVAGRKSFTVRNPDKLPVGWDSESKELLITLRNALQEMTGTFDMEEGNPIFYVDPRYKDRSDSVIQVDMETFDSWATALDEARRQLAQEDVSGQEAVEAKIKALKDEQSYSLFGWLDSIYQAKEILGTLAKAQNVQLPHMSGRDVSQIVWDDSDFSGTLESFAEQPLGTAPSVDDLRQYDETYFTAYRDTALKPPSTHRDVAIQHDILNQWLSDNPEADSYADVSSYLSDLSKLGSNFAIPNILDVKKIELGDGVEAYLNTKPHIFSNGNFLLWTPTGSVNPDTHGILNHFWDKRAGNDIWTFTSDMLPDYVDQAGLNPAPDEIPSDTEIKIPYMSDEIKKNLLPALYKLSAELPDGTMKDALSQIYKSNDAGEREIAPNNIDHNIVRSIPNLGQYIGKRAGTDLDQLAHGKMEDKDRDEDTKLGVKHWLQDNWKDLFGEGIDQPTSYGRSGEYNWSQLVGIADKINGYADSIIERRRRWGVAPVGQPGTVQQSETEQEQPLSTEEQEDMALINTFIDKLAQGDPSVTPAALRTMLDAVNKQLDPEDYAKILAARQDIPYSEWEQFPNFENHYDTLSDDQKALYNPPPPDEEDQTGGPSEGDDGPIISPGDPVTDDDQTGGPAAQPAPRISSVQQGLAGGTGGGEIPRPVPVVEDDEEDTSQRSGFTNTADHQEGLRLLTVYKRMIDNYNKKIDNDGNAVGFQESTVDKWLGKARTAARKFDEWNAEGAAEGVALKIVLPTEQQISERRQQKLLDHEDTTAGAKATPRWSTNRDGTPKDRFIPSWLTTIEEGTDEPDPLDEIRMRTDISNDEKLAWLNESGWKPALNPAQSRPLDTLYYGKNENYVEGDGSDPWYIYHKPSPQEQKDRNLTKLFDVGPTFGYPHAVSSSGEAGQPNDEYLKLSDDFKQRQMKAEEKGILEPGMAQNVYDSYQAHFRDYLTLNMQNEEVKNWWDGLALDAQGNPSTAGAALQQSILDDIDTNFLNEDGTPIMKYGTRKIVFGTLALNEILLSHVESPEDMDIFKEISADARTISDEIGELLGPTGEDILSRPVPRTAYNRHNVDTGVEETVNSGFIEHPGAAGRFSPKGLLVYGYKLSSRYYELLADLMDEAAIEQLGGMGISRDELQPPKWDNPKQAFVVEGTDDPYTAEDWASIKGFLGESKGVLPGVNKLRLDTRYSVEEYNDQGGVVETTEKLTYDKQLANIEHYIGALKKAYTTMATKYSGFKMDTGKKDEAGEKILVDLGEYDWDKQMGVPPVELAAENSGNTISNAMNGHLVDLGLLEESTFTRTGSQRHNVRADAMISSSNPDGLFTDDIFTDGKLNFATVADKAKVGEWVKNVYATRKGVGFNDAAYQLHYGEEDTPAPIVSTTEPGGELTKQERMALGALGWLPDDLEHHDADKWRQDIEDETRRPRNWKPPEPPSIITGDGTGDGTGTGGTGAGDAGDEEEPSRRDQLIAAIQETYKTYDPGLLNVKEVEKVYNDMQNRLNAQILAGVIDPKINGERRKKLEAEINTNRKNLGLHELPPDTLGNMDDKVLDKHHADISEKVSEQDREAFIKDANNPTIPELGEAALGNKNSLLNQWRRISHHAHIYGKDYTDKTKQVQDSLSLQTYEALKALVGEDVDVVEMLDNDRQPFEVEGSTPEDTRLQEIDGVEYGSVAHIEAEHEKAMTEFNKHQAWADYLRGANEDMGVPEEVQHPNRGANTFLYPDETGVLTSYEMLEAGSRMTTPTGNFLGKRKGELVFSNEDPAHQGGMFVTGGSYSQLYEGDQPHELGDVSPTFNNMLKPPKVFGLPEDVEEAYQTIHRTRLESRELLRHFFGDDVKSIDFKFMPSEDADLEAFNELYPDQSPQEVIPQLEQEHNEALEVLNQAVTDNKIHAETLDILNNSAGYDRMDARDAFLQDHTPEGLPIDPNGELGETPQYIDSSGEPHNRVYHRATKMWYDPEMLDDLRNRGRGSIGTILSNPYDAPNIAGLKQGEKWDQTDTSDLYRLAVPAVNHTTFFDADGNVNNDIHHGIIISPTGVHKVAKPDVPTDIPTMDAEGKLVDHPVDENGNQRPYTPEEVSQSSFELSRLNSEMSNPNAYTDEQGNTKNMISVDEEGYFDGGWGEWWNAGGKLGALEAPGIRNIWGARQWDRFVRGRPADRIKPSDNINVQSSAGKQVWGNLGGTPVNEPVPKSRAEKIRNKEDLYTEPPQQMRQNRLRAAFDAVQISLNEMGVRQLTDENGNSRLSEVSKLNQFLAGKDPDALEQAKYEKLMRENAPQFGASPKDIEDRLSAEKVQREQHGDPRYTKYGASPEGDPDSSPPIQTQPPPVGQQIVDPTQQVVYGPGGEEISPPDPNLMQQARVNKRPEAV